MKKALITLVLVSGLLSISTSAKANYLNGNSYAAEATKSATAKKNVRVYKITTGKYESENKASFFGYLRKGTTVKRSNYVMSTGGWIIKSGKYYHNKRTFFLIAKGDWYYKSKHVVKPTHHVIHKENYKIAKYSTFSSHRFKIGYLNDIDHNYKFYKYDKDMGIPGTQVAFTIKNSLIPLRVKKSGIDADGYNVVDVMYKGTHASEEMFSGANAVHPYNTYKTDSNTVSSETTPYSGKAVLKKSINTNKIKFWLYSTGGKSTLYQKIKGGWIYNS